MEKRILVPVADGVEMIEALTVVDVFRRAGSRVDIASANTARGLEVCSSHGVRFFADLLIDECLDVHYDLIAVPGGIPGAEHLRDCSALQTILKNQSARRGYYGAICAAPALVLQHHGLLAGKEATGHPHYVATLPHLATDGRKVVIDGNCVTSRGAGTALDFALALCGLVLGDAKRDEVVKGMAL